MSAEKEVWPDYLMIRDTGLHDDMGGLGQRIHTTAGAGYKKVKYVRADIAERDAAEIVRLRGGVEALRQCGVKYLGWLGVKNAEKALREDMADPEMVDRPAPAMPNGVEDQWKAAVLDQLAWTHMDAPQGEAPESILRRIIKWHVDVAFDTGADVEALTSRRAAENRDASGVCDCPGIGKADKALHAPNCPVRTTPAAVPAGEAVAYSVVQIGNRGAAYDPPNTHRAFTYEHQPGNIDASRLGRATNAAAVASAGDSIDRGLSLLKELQAIGFGVFQIGPPAPVQAAPQEGEVAYWERWHPTHGVVSVNREPLGESIVDNRWEDRPLYRANPSACELVVDDAMVERACLYHFPDWDMYGPAGKMVRSADIRRLLTAALQHRGDSQEVGRV